MTEFADEIDPGEGLDVEERLIVAPAVGIFRPIDEEGYGRVKAGQAIGTLESVGAEPRTVRSPHAGRMAGLLAKAGERVRAGQPVAWLRAIA
jgi:biotin carboxyl carrier protein